MKFSLFLITAICAFQAYEARIFDLNNFGGITDMSIEDIIKENIEKIEDRLAKASDKIKEIVEEIEEEIQEIPCKIDNIKEEIIEKIKKLIGGTVDVVENCIKTNEKDLDDMVNEYKNGQQPCMNNANENMKDVSAKLGKLYQDADEMKNKIVAKAEECENELNPMVCIMRKMPELAKLVSTIFKECETFESSMIKTGTDLEKCEKDVADKMEKLEEAYLGKMKQCVTNHKDD